MRPTEILRQAFDACIQVSIAASGNLYVQPMDRLPPALRALLVEHKPEVLAYMREADALVPELMAWAMTACDRNGDGPKARAAMRADVEATPRHLRADLFAHLREAWAAGGAS